MIIFLSTIENISDRNKAAALYEKYGRLMLYVANSILYDNFLAEDAVLAAFEKIIKNLHKINEIDCNETRNYVVIICKSTALDMLKKPSPDFLEDGQSEPQSPVNMVENLSSAQAVEQIKRCISALKPEYALILQLKAVENLTIPQLARVLDITEENARVRLHRARAELKKLLEKEGICCE